MLLFSYTFRLLYGKAFISGCLKPYPKYGHAYVLVLPVAESQHWMWAVVNLWLRTLCVWSLHRNVKKTLVPICFCSVSRLVGALLFYPGLRLALQWWSTG